MSRRERQLDALRHLCAIGAVSRALDLAFEHFAAFGRDDAIFELLVAAIGEIPGADELRPRLAELRASPG